MLIVDDEPLLLVAMADVLGDVYDIVTAASVAAAVQALEGARFDAVLSDVQLPDGTAAAVRAAIGDARLILLTGGTTYEANRIAGVAPVIEKPFDIDELPAQIARLLGDET